MTTRSVWNRLGGKCKIKKSAAHGRLGPEPQLLACSKQLPRQDKPDYHYWKERKTMDSLR
ncbi:hypothetical protein ARTHRO9V_160221 [Arthrobacter sp. 9V]|nr:hypothetical protein ARTHRO9V_160221 [Arthrobacter sp. 9V]